MVSYNCCKTFSRKATEVFLTIKIFCICANHWVKNSEFSKATLSLRSLSHKPTKNQGSN